MPWGDLGHFVFRGKNGGKAGIQREERHVHRLQRGNTQGLLASDISSLLEVRENNTQAIVEAIDAALAKSMEEIGLVAEGYAKKACPTDTGRLKNSITHLVGDGGRAAYIGTNVEYAIFVEEGHSTRSGTKVEGVHFLKNAATNHGDKYRAILRSNMGK